MEQEETTVGKHRHKRDWKISYQDDPEPDIYFEIWECNKCGVVFVMKKNGTIPQGE